MPADCVPPWIAGLLDDFCLLKRVRIPTVESHDRLADYETDQQCGDEEQRQFAHGDPVFVAVDSGGGGAHGGDGMRGRQERADLCGENEKQRS